MTAFGADEGLSGGASDAVVRPIVVELRERVASHGGLPATRRANRSVRRLIPAGADTANRLRARLVAAATAATFAMYVAVGVWLVNAQNYMINDAVSRTVSAKLMVASRDPHLAAVGFYWQPIPTVARVPFVMVLDRFDQSLFAGPVTSSLFAAATLPVLVAIGRALRLRTRTIGIVVIAHALNPVTIYFAANGMSESTFGFFLALAVLLFVRWRNSEDSRHLVLFGLAVAACAACRHEVLVMLPALMAGVAIVAGRKDRRAAVVLAAVPTIAWLAMWVTVSKLITGEWFFWYVASRPTTATPQGAQWLPEELGPVPAVLHVVVLVLAYSPALVPAALGAVLATSRSETLLVLFGVAATLPAALAWQLADGSSWMVPRFLVHTPLVGAMAALAVTAASHETIESRGALKVRTPLRAVNAGAARWFAFAAVLAVPLGAITATAYLADPDRAHAEGEYLLMAPLLGRENPREEPGYDASNEVFDVRLDAQRRLAADLDKQIDAAINEGSETLEPMVVMDSLQATTVLLSVHGDRFIVPEDRDFEEILSDPIGRFEFIVVLDGRAPTEFSELIANELQRERIDGGTWSLVGSYPGAGNVYRFAPT